jgi:hypothetical protein
VSGNCPFGLRRIVIARPAIARPTKMADIIKRFNSIYNDFIKYKYTKTLRILRS